MLSKLAIPSDDPVYINFAKALTDGYTDFSTQWDEIFTRIRKLNPRAEIYVDNIYNPLRYPDSLYFPGISGLMDAMNNQIESSASPFNYHYINVHDTFEDTEGVLTFSISGAIANVGVLSDADQSNDYIFQQCVDPHPTVTGHQAIFDLIQESTDD